MAAQHISQVKNAIDATLGTGLVTFPFWMQGLGWGLGILVSICGLVLGYYRIRIARLEWQEKKRAAAEKERQ